MNVVAVGSDAFAEPVEAALALSSQVPAAFQLSVLPLMEHEAVPKSETENVSAPPPLAVA